MFLEGVEEVPFLRPTFKEDGVSTTSSIQVVSALNVSVFGLSDFLPLKPCDVIVRLEGAGFLCCLTSFYFPNTLGGECNSLECT